MPKIKNETTDISDFFSQWAGSSKKVKNVRFVGGFARAGAVTAEALFYRLLKWF